MPPQDKFIFVYIIDKKILQFKLKGIVEWIMFASVVVVMVYPINNMNDFNTDSTLRNPQYWIVSFTLCIHLVRA